ncbi:MAG: hypothetical protein EPO11_06910 [Gammaproteobacteria bacterium]|nr:MAG: hypothetical protein EPO11_06910 [Gammaproteobacteria bacterium]
MKRLFYVGKQSLMPTFLELQEEYHRIKIDCSLLEEKAQEFFNEHYKQIRKTFSALGLSTNLPPNIIPIGLDQDTYTATAKMMVLNQLKTRLFERSCDFHDYIEQHIIGNSEQEDTLRKMSGWLQMKIIGLCTHVDFLSNQYPQMIVLGSEMMKHLDLLKKTPSTDEKIEFEETIFYVNLTFFHLFDFYSLALENSIQEKIADLNSIAQLKNLIKKFKPFLEKIKDPQLATQSYIFLADIKQSKIIRNFTRIYDKKDPQGTEIIDHKEAYNLLENALKFAGQIEDNPILKKTLLCYTYVSMLLTEQNKKIQSIAILLGKNNTASLTQLEHNTLTDSRCDFQNLFNQDYVTQLMKLIADIADNPSQIPTNRHYYHNGLWNPYTIMRGIISYLRIAYNQWEPNVEKTLNSYPFDSTYNNLSTTLRPNFSTTGAWYILKLALENKKTILKAYSLIYKLEKSFGEKKPAYDITANQKLLKQISNKIRELNELKEKFDKTTTRLSIGMLNAFTAKSAENRQDQLKKATHGIKRKSELHSDNTSFMLKEPSENPLLITAYTQFKNGNYEDAVKTYEEFEKSPDYNDDLNFIKSNFGKGDCYAAIAAEARIKNNWRRANPYQREAEAVYREALDFAKKKKGKYDQHTLQYKEIKVYQEFLEDILDEEEENANKDSITLLIKENTIEQPSPAVPSLPQEKLFKKKYTLTMDLPAPVQWVFDLLLKESKKSEKPCFYGGCVRDAILKGIFSNDYDMKIDLSLEECESLFSSHQYNNQPIKSKLIKGNITILYVEIDNYKIQLSNFSKNPGEDKLRNTALEADLTMNGLIYIHEHNIILDFVGGFEDLKTRTLVPVGSIEHMKDPTRLLRLLRFKAKFEDEHHFKLNKEVEKLLREEKHASEQHSIFKDINPGTLYYHITRLFFSGYADNAQKELTAYAPIFNRIFTHTTPNQLIKLMLAEIDEKARLSLPINASIFFAVMLWDAMQVKLENFILKDNAESDKIFHAITNTIFSEQKFHIPEKIRNRTSQIWWIYLREKKSLPILQDLFTYAELSRAEKFSSLLTEARAHTNNNNSISAFSQQNKKNLKALAHKRLKDFLPLLETTKNKLQLIIKFNSAKQSSQPELWEVLKTNLPDLVENNRLKNIVFKAQANNLVINCSSNQEAETTMKKLLQYGVNDAKNPRPIATPKLA